MILLQSRSTAFLIIPDSSENEALYTRIFSKLESTFANHAIQEYSRSLDAMRLIAPLENNTIAQSSYSLFRVILSSSFEKEEIWTAARFAMHGAYKWDKFLPWVEGPDDVIDFLAHHFAIQAKGEDDVAKQPIEDALRAIAYASNETTLEVLKRFDHTDKVFVDGIRKAFEEDRPFQTRKAAVFIMPIIQDKWFDDSSEGIMSDEEKDEFCKNWGSAADNVKRSIDKRKATCATLFAMLNSEQWRSHIVMDNLKLVDYFTDLSDDPKLRFIDLPDDSKYFTACKRNASILPWLRSKADEAGKEGTEETKLWKLWLAILWSDYVNLPEDVGDQVMEVTEVVISKARNDVSFISRIMTTEKEKYRQKLGKHEAWSLEDEAERLRIKVADLDECARKFTEVVGKGTSG